MWGAEGEQSRGAGAASQGLLCCRCTKSCRVFVMVPEAADSPLVSPKCHLCDPESPSPTCRGKVEPVKGSAVSVVRWWQGTGGCQSRVPGCNPAMGPGSHRIYRAQAWSATEGAPAATPRGCCVPGQDLGLTSPQGCGTHRHFLLGRAVFPGICSVPALLLSKGKGHSHTWDGAVSIFCVHAVISASPQDRISALLKTKPLRGEELGKPFARGSPSALCFQVPQIQCWRCPPTAMEPWGSDSCLA